MIYLSLFLSLSLSASALTVRHRRTISNNNNNNNNNWNEAASDFKSLLKAITFNEPLPSHHDNPLQMTAPLASDQPLGLFIIAAESAPQPIIRKTEAKRSMAGAMSQEELMLLNFLVEQEEPSARVKADLKRADERYRSIQSERKKSQKVKSQKVKSQKVKDKSKKMKSVKSKPSQSKLSKPSQSKSKSKSFIDKLDLKGARNKLTISVAFAVIVTALFCIVVQLFRLFSRPESGTGFDRLARRSHVGGYERIALDVEEEDEAMPLNA